MWTIQEAASALRARRLSCRELTAQALTNARRLQPQLNAFITLTEESALARADALDVDLANGQDHGPLHGITVAHKDCFYTKGLRTTDGSGLFSNFVPDHDAAVVARLHTAGMVSLGKLNMHELAYGITSQNEYFGGVRNPWDLNAIPGGSSGGSGAAVAAGILFCGTGTDTGGSIRIPASYCGTTGLKTTFGRVSRYGCFALAPSFDTMGPLTRTVRDTALCYAAMAGYDERDPVSQRQPVELPAFTPEARLDGVRIGLPENFFNERVDPAVLAAVEAMARAAQAAGARIVKVRVPDMLALNSATITVQLGESSATFAAQRDRWNEVGAVPRAILERGLSITAVDFLLAQQTIAGFRQEFSAVWQHCDCLFAASTPVAAPPIGQQSITLEGVEEEVRIATTRLQRGVNALGLPALALPCGAAPDGRPYGLQIIGAPFAEASLLRIGAAVEDRTEFHQRHPSL